MFSEGFCGIPIESNILDNTRNLSIIMMKMMICFFVVWLTDKRHLALFPAGFESAQNLNSGLVQ